MVCSGKAKVAGKRKQGRTACPKARLRGVYAPQSSGTAGTCAPGILYTNPAALCSAELHFAEKTAENG